MTARVLVSHITTGLLLANPWPDFGSTAAPPRCSRDFTDRVERIQIEDGNARFRSVRALRSGHSGPCAEYKLSAIGIGVDVIETAGTAGFYSLNYRIWT